jgi:hypothetical protein
MSASVIYAYAGNDPVNFSDPNGHNRRRSSSSSSPWSSWNNSLRNRQLELLREIRRYEPNFRGPQSIESRNPNPRNTFESLRQTNRGLETTLRELSNSGVCWPERVPQRRGPKTDDSAPHNAAIIRERDRLQAGGNRIFAGGRTQDREQLVKTPGGFKEGRRPDIIYRTPSGQERGLNVGRTLADGVTPVTREQRALQDLNGPGNLPTDFTTWFP